MASEAMSKMGRAYGKFLKTQSGGCYNKYEDFAVSPESVKKIWRGSVN